ncbi:Protection of telomeres protein 1 [Madurella mycetomatis]|uniref:Protection of telomeres protein 1 n=1 Tax=Madurella mycetomatis TaxID=100816 RepID=A0A175VZT3_9PEZI|nr:Protection of telomeres protein 1 [Madurella mycetomatis]
MPVRGQPKAAAPLPTEPSLPSRFTEIRAILEGRLASGSLTNVIGLVKDCRLPTATNGPDFKCTLILKDLSIEDDNDGIEFNIFRSEADMPQVAAADVVLLTRVKVQEYRSNLSLIAHATTSIRTYTASKIPRLPDTAQVALAPAPKRDSYVPNREENHYVSYFYHKVNKDDVPDEHTFRARAEQSLNVKEKFSELKDVRDGRFYDLIVQVVKEPYDSGSGNLTLYVSDYTENLNFFHKTWDGLEGPGLGGGDPFGYTSHGASTLKDWAGPYGKMSIQITCYEPHASIIRSEVTSGLWVQLRNVQIKYGRDGQFLEGFMREDRGVAGAKISVDVLEVTDRDTIDPRLLKAIGRCRDYHKKKKEQIKKIKAAEAAGQKRKASLSLEQGTRPPNTNDRRRLKRATQEQKQRGRDASEQPRLDVNDQVQCEVHPAPLSTIESILEPKLWETIVEGKKTFLAVPFICAKYRSRVRIVDFFPPSLENFACSRKQTCYDGLNDNEDSSDNSSSSSSNDIAARSAPRVWEWRFALQVEDPAPPETTERKNRKQDPRPRLWVLVDNTEAECLTSLTATDLRQDQKTLELLRERMAILWGNLEDRKTKAAAWRQEREEARNAANDEKRRRRLGDAAHLRLERPPLESSDAEDDAGDDEPLSNKPFACCIRQYGIYDKQREGAEWVRCFGLFGTKISIY